MDTRLRPVSPTVLPEDLEQLRQMTEQFTAGDIPAARYQAFRVPLGIYEQRENGTYMLRVRLPVCCCRGKCG